MSHDVSDSEQSPVDPLVSVIVPALNEERHIAALLEVLCRQVTSFAYEVVVVDGSSSDDTVSEAARVMGSTGLTCVHAVIVDNPTGRTPEAMNIGLRSVRGVFVVRVDAHTGIAPDHLQRLVDAYRDLQADDPLVGCVGGTLVHTNHTTTTASAIALAQSSVVGNGGASYRRGVARATRVDTVAFGVSRSADLRAIGGFDDRFLRNSDDELNLRLRRAGRTIYCVPDILVRYHGRSTFRGLARQYFQYGLFKPAVFIENRMRPLVRNLAPVVLVVGLGTTVTTAVVRRRPILAIPAIAYLAGCVALGTRSSRGRSGARVALATAVMHISYGSGAIVGLARYGIGLGMPDM